MGYSILNETNQNTRIVSYCSLGYRSAIVTNRIREMSVKDSDVNVNTDNVFNLEGSIFIIRQTLAHVCT